MALPGDVSTCTVTFGPYLDATGVPQFVGMTGTITPSWPVTDLSSGAVLTDAAVTVTIDSTGSASVTVPHTDQATLYPSNFTYSATWTRGRHPGTPSVRKFALPVSAGATADFDRMTQANTAAGPSIFLPAVVSVNGHTGAVALSASDVGADPAGAAATAQTAAVAASAGQVTDTAVAAAWNTKTGAKAAADPILKAAFVAGNVYNSDGSRNTVKTLHVVLTADGTDIQDLIIQ